MKFHIRLAEVYEVDELTDLVIRSKFHWNYDARYRAPLRDLIRVSRKRVSAGDCWVAETDDGEKAAVCQLDPISDPPHLDLLFVEPKFIGQGAGTLLFENLLTECRHRGIATFDMDADPNATEFYLRKGGRIVGEFESTVVRGQLLPIIEITL